jgi:proline iminopeptidase
MQPLFPAIKNNNHFFLAVDALHSLYIEESGTETGIPVIFLHGGPGSGCEPFHRRFFDPKKYRIILFDQRGCGRSKPHAELRDNTSQHLLADMEKIREKLGIEKWMVFGGSWGSTLALLYAETYPERVSALIVRGIFLGRQKDIDWFYQEGASRIYPDYWKHFIEPIAEDKRDNLLRAYHSLLIGENEIARSRAAKAWSTWEGMTANLSPKGSVLDHFTDLHYALSIARIEAHYFVNNNFLSDNQLINNADKLYDIPGIIIQGRYDMICPIEQAFELHAAWQTAVLEVIPACGHAASEPAIIDALVKATETMADVLS